MSREDEFEGEEFIALLVAGDKQAWGDLYLHIKSHLVSHIVNGLGGGAGYQPDAEEILNEVFINAFKSYEGRCPPIPYLFILANNTVKNRRKQKKAHDALPEDLPDQRLDPEEEYEEKERKEIIKARIGVLPPKLREVFKLRFLEDLKNCEIAEMLGISTNYVGVLINRGIKKVRGLNEKVEVTVPGARNGDGRSFSRKLT
jgi:RNA polymerase sigma-70 factor (ECF subfamily)